MLAYHNDPKIKTDILSQLQEHAAADQIVKGHYWQDGKGCAIGCTIHSDDHMDYETRFGIPIMLARLEDCIFEGLPNDAAKTWPIRFMSAIEPGIDLSTVGWKFLHWLLTDEEVNPGINHPIVKDAVKRCADALLPLTVGQSIDISAASAAWSAARAAARSAAAWSADSSAAWSAVWGADSAAAWSADSSAAWSADSSAAWSAARSAAVWGAESSYILMADKLLTLLSEAQPPSELRNEVSDANDTSSLPPDTSRS